MTAETMTARDVVTALIGESDDRARQLRAELAAWRDGYQAGAADAERQYGRGYVQCAADVKAVHHVVYNHVAAGARDESWRWIVRGERRDRETFGQPHPADYPGGPVQPW